MAVFDSTVVSGNTGDAAQLEAELENALPSRRARFGTTSAVSFTDSTTVIADLTVADVAADDVLQIIAHSSLSGSAANNECQVAIRVNGSIVHNTRLSTGGHTGTGGDRVPVTIAFNAENLSGSVLIEIVAIRTSGSGTLYLSRRAIDVIVSKKRA